MPIYQPDERRVINPATTNLFFPLPTVAALDIETNFPTRVAYGLGSAIVIAPNYVLTAAHNIKGKPVDNNLRVTTSANQDNLNSRIIGATGDPAVNVNDNDKIYITDYLNKRKAKDDILLLKTSNTLLDAEDVIGLMAFVNPRDAVGLSIRTAGYPGDNVPNTIQDSRYNYNFDNPGIPGHTNREARDLVLAPGSLSSGSIVGIRNQRNFFFSQNIDSYRGQSGSGVWHTLEGDSKPRVLGILTGRPGSGRQAIDGNGGVILTTELYDSIVLEIEKDTNSNNAELLPESAIIGSNRSFFFFGGNDNIFGSFLRERIIGNGGDDNLYGGGGDDRLEGGEGIDQAVFSDEFINYNWTTPNEDNDFVFEFDHNVVGNQGDGRDTAKDIEFGVFEFKDSDLDGRDDDGNLFYVPLEVDPENAAKLKDGEIISPKEKLLNEEGEEIATMTVQSPAWMFDGDVKYNLSIGLDITESYNIAFIIDRSGSMGGGRLTDTKNALNQLIDSFEQSGIDSNIDYSIISFSDFFNRNDTSNSDTATTLINAINAGGGTVYSGALSSASAFFVSQFQFRNASNLAYFISDGYPNSNDLGYLGAASNLKLLTDEVRAFGVGGANLSILNLIDSDGSAEYLSNASDLFDAFDTSIDRDLIDRIEVRQEGRPDLIETITPDKLTEEGFNLTYEGTIDGLTVSREAENNITFELIFKEETGLDNLLLDYTITTGQEEVRQLVNNGRNEIINFSVNQTDFNDDENFLSESEIEEREIFGNDLGNTIEISGGTNEISANGGNDNILLLGGTAIIDGGEGIDTVTIATARADAGDISQTENVVNIGKNYSLVNVEYVQFSDERLAVGANTLVTTPVISVVNRGITVQEKDTGSNFATFNLVLSSATTENLVIDVAATSDLAEAGVDYLEPSQLIIPAGETSATLSLEILGDTDIEGDEEIYLDLTTASNVTFVNGTKSQTLGINLLDNETSLITDEDTLITISAARLLNDYVDSLYGDNSADDFSIVGVNSDNGTAAINSEGDVEFTPAANLNGTVSFELTVTDGTDNYTELVEVEVIPVNDPLVANNDTTTTDEDVPVTILASQLFANDANEDREQSFISKVDNAVNGTVVLDRDGNVRFVPDSNFYGIASFDYTVTDGIDTETASVEVTVNPVNDAPVANNDTAITDEDTPITILATELLSNDSDIDGDNLSITGVNSDDGRATINADGNIDFTPSANFNGTASFDYTVSDGVLTSTALVEVVVNPINDVLIANDDTITTDEDTPIANLASKLFANDVNEDPEKSLSITQISNLIGGTVIIENNQNVNFIPSTNFYGTASFDYTVTDGIDIETASVEVTVNSVNDAPIANNDTTAAIDEDTSVTILATELLGNDSDVDGDSLSITEVDSRNGVATLNADGNIEFTPDANFNGTASFNYIVTDGTDTATASVEVEVNPVNDILIANNDAVVTDEDTSINIVADDLFANDINDDIEKSLSISKVTNPVNGTVVLSSNGNVQFTPDTNFNGIASFDYTVTDGIDIETTSVEVTINAVDDAPIAVRDFITADEDVLTTFSATELLSNDFDYDIEDSLSIVEVNNFKNGTATINDDGNVEFLADANFIGGASFDYLITDGTSIAKATAYVRVDSVNDLPFIIKPLPDYTVTPDAPDRKIYLNDFFDDVDPDISRLGYGGSALTTLFNPYDITFVNNDSFLILGYQGFRDLIELGGRFVGDLNYDITITPYDQFGPSTGSTFTVSVLVPDEDPNLLEGAEGDDYLNGELGDDTLIGNGGNDTLIGNGGDDSIDGGAGDDILVETADTDFTLTDTTLVGNGNDTISQIEFVELTGGMGNNVLMARDVAEISVTLDGLEGNDNLVGGAKNDSLKGGEGNDRLAGKNGNDNLVGGQGFDTLYGGAGNDSLDGGAGNDILFGGEGNDTISAYGGDDTITTGAGTDKVDGGEGIDTVVYNDVAYGNGSAVSLGKVANSVSYSDTDTLTDVEFIQFSNVRVSADTLEVTPVVEVGELTITERNSGNTTARLDLNLDTPAPVDITFDYSTEDLDAYAGEDYVAKSGQIVIPAGETTATINLTVMGDTDYEPTELFGLNFSALTGATFDNNRVDYSVPIAIENDDILPLRVNAGKDDVYTDSLGLEWSANNGFSGGRNYANSNAIAQTDDDLLYQSEYLGENFFYSQDVINGSYDVTLHFAEIYFNGAGRRVFDVSAENQLVLDNFDVFAEAGGKDIALEKTFTVPVSDGSLDLEFLAGVNNAKISAVEIKPTGTPIRVNGGSENYTDLLGKEWLFNDGLSGGRNSSRDNAISQTDNDSLYQTEYYGANFDYSQSVANGNYDVTLHFAETVFSQSGRRVFDVSAENQLILDNFDVFAEAGGRNIALEKTFVVGVNDGNLDLDFLAEVNNAKISAIEVEPSEIIARVNGGSENYTDSLGQEWSGNMGLSGGRSSSRNNAIAQTDRDPLYQSEYYDKNFIYSQSVANGSYDVTLHFAETVFFRTGQRVFDVSAENQLILNDFDIVSEVGGQNIALEKTFTIGVNDGTLDLDFLAEVNNAKISAIEIKPDNTIARVNAGEDNIYTDSLGLEWSGNNGFSGGRSSSRNNAIAQTDNDPLYQSEYYGQDFDYSQSVANGSYDVTLHFAETVFFRSGQRVFDVSAEDQLVLDNFDIIDEAGGQNIAMEKTFTVGVNDGTLNLDFVAEVNNAKISAIEIEPSII